MGRSWGKSLTLPKHSPFLAVGIRLSAGHRRSERQGLPTFERKRGQHMSMIRTMRRKSVLVAAVAAAAAASTWSGVAPAATLTWTGGGADNNWGTAANWV